MFLVSIPRALLVALALLQAVGITDYVRRAACEQECERDGCDDKGLCEGTSCACHCPGAPSIDAPRIATASVAPPLAETSVVFADHDDLLASPDPREILHVPRACAA